MVKITFIEGVELKYELNLSNFETYLNLNRYNTFLTLHSKFEAKGIASKKLKQKVNNWVSKI